MRKIVVSEFVSPDGVMQAPGGADEDTDGGFVHGGWTHPYWHDDIGAHSRVDHQVRRAAPRTQDVGDSRRRLRADGR
jgi:hypothetical protein